jgi:F-type H+-transporting ATPase subunit delta
MNESKISVRYTKALFNLAKEMNLHKQVRTDMENLQKLITDVAEFRLLIDNPIMKPSQKMDILNLIVKDRIHQVTQSFIELIVQNNRLSYLDSIARVYLNIFKKDQGIEPATIQTAVPIDETLRHTLIRIIEKRMHIKIELEEETDVSLIGGFILKIGNQQIDASIARQLSNIKKELISS